MYRTAVMIWERGFWIVADIGVIRPFLGVSSYLNAFGVQQAWIDMSLFSIAYSLIIHSHTHTHTL